jgi:hypothetical protein
MIQSLLIKRKINLQRAGVNLTKRKKIRKTKIKRRKRSILVLMMMSKEVIRKEGKVGIRRGARTLKRDPQYCERIWFDLLSGMMWCTVNYHLEYF